MTGVKDGEHTSVNGRRIRPLLVRHRKSLRYGTHTNKAIERKLVTRRVSDQVGKTLKYVHLNSKHWGRIVQDPGWASQVWHCKSGVTGQHGNVGRLEV